MRSLQLPVAFAGPRRYPCPARRRSIHSVASSATASNSSNGFDQKATVRRLPTRTWRAGRMVGVPSVPAQNTGVSPSSLSIAWILHTRLGLDSHIANLGTMAATLVGLALVYATRRRARLSFLLTILVVIYCSPVVLVGNFALLVAAVAPWVVPDRAGAAVTRRPASVGDMATRHGFLRDEPAVPAVVRRP